VPDDDRLTRLHALIGDWDTTITMIEADGSDGAVFMASDIYA
jgi:hypothetical protein